MERNTPTPAVSAAASRRGLFADNEPFASGWLPADAGHEIYYEECGAAQGKPCVILHGGPGGAINPTMRRFFDPGEGGVGAVRPGRRGQGPPQPRPGGQTH